MDLREQTVFDHANALAEWRDAMADLIAGESERRPDGQFWETPEFERFRAVEDAIIDDRSGKLEAIEAQLFVTLQMVADEASDPAAVQRFAENGDLDKLLTLDEPYAIPRAIIGALVNLRLLRMSGDIRPAVDMAG